VRNAGFERATIKTLAQLRPAYGNGISGGARGGSRICDLYRMKSERKYQSGTISAVLMDVADFSSDTLSERAGLSPFYEIDQVVSFSLKEPLQVLLENGKHLIYVHVA
jgi:hypothetical protein